MIKKILVSQPKPTSDKSPYFDIEAKYNVEITFKPFIRVEGLSVKEFRQSKVNLADFTAVILTARTAVDNFFRLCEESRVHVPDTMRYFCTNEATAHYLQKYIVYRKRKIFFGSSGKLDDPALLAAMVKNNKEKFLFPISSVDLENPLVVDAQDKMLHEHKINFTRAVMYRTVSTEFTPEEIAGYDALIFFSPAGITSLLDNDPSFDQKKLGTSIGTFGMPTTQAAEKAGLTVNFTAPTPEFPSMVAALDNYLKSRED